MLLLMAGAATQDGMLRAGVQSLLALRQTCKAAAAFGQAACTFEQLHAVVLTEQLRELLTHELTDMRAELHVLNGVMQQLHAAYQQAVANGEQAQVRFNPRDSLRAKRAVGRAMAGFASIQSRAQLVAARSPPEPCGELLASTLATFPPMFAEAQRTLGFVRDIESERARQRNLSS